jgi:hypothetical protein
MPIQPVHDGRADEQPAQPDGGPFASSRGSLVDRHVGRVRRRAMDMTASEIRALFVVAARPEIRVAGRPAPTAAKQESTRSHTGKRRDRRESPPLKAEWKSIGGMVTRHRAGYLMSRMCIPAR